MGKYGVMGSAGLWGATSGGLIYASNEGMIDESWVGPGIVGSGILFTLTGLISLVSLGSTKDIRSGKSERRLQEATRTAGNLPLLGTVAGLGFVGVPGLWYLDETFGFTGQAGEYARESLYNFGTNVKDEIKETVANW